MAMDLRREQCDRRRLDLFLQNELPEDSQHDLESHLEFCPACRDNLDNLAGGAQLWTEIRQYLGSDGAEEYPSDRSGSATARRVVNVDLSFLQPSDSPAALGRLGTYEVLEVVGRGGWGVVLKAFEPALHRPVAIKVLAPEYAANANARKRFAREAQAVAAVIHDHVVPVHAVDADSTPPYLVMAFIAGQSLQQRIDHSGALELKEVLRIGMQMASGLAAAHAQGLVHRDIKPANIMLENGIERVRITDFGLARAVHDASVTQSGAVTGTPQYMSPEQAEGAAVDQRADLFALGSTMYAMAAGKAPFQGESALAIMRQVCDCEPAPIRQVNAAVPIWLEGIILKLHKKDAAERFQTAAEVAELLEGCLAHVQQPDRHPLPALANKLGREVPGVKKSRRSLHAVLAGVALIAVLGGGALRLNMARDYDPDGRRSEEAVSEGFVALRAQVDSIVQSQSPVLPSNVPDLDTGLGQLMQRAEKLRRELSVVPPPPPDVVEFELQQLHRQLELLKERVGGGDE
jgi:eukaryotic-like serine/threonine-protein kinase